MPDMGAPYEGAVDAPEMVPLDDGTTRRDAAWRGAYAGAFGAIAAVLSARLLLLLTAAGGFALAWQALVASSTGALIAAGCYYVGVMLPVTLLAARQR